MNADDDDEMKTLKAAATGQRPISHWCSVVIKLKG